MNNEMKETSKITDKRTVLKGDYRKNIMLWCLFTAAIIFLVLDLFFYRHSGFEPGSLGALIEGFAGAYSLIGLASMIFLIFVSKIIKKVIARNLDYYGDKDV